MRDEFIERYAEGSMRRKRGSDIDSEIDRFREKITPHKPKEENVSDLNLVEGIQKECNRCRKLRKDYDAIPIGVFGATFIQNAIDEGEASIASGDCIRMLQAYKALESCS